MVYRTSVRIQSNNLEVIVEGNRDQWTDKQLELSEVSFMPIFV